MARVRFPGRPGHRFDQIRVAYFNDDIKNYQDPSLAFLPQFRHGLRTFHELVGTSDEDEEFEGFSPEDVQESETKLEEIEQEIEKQEKKKEEQMVDLYQIPSARPVRVRKQQEPQPAAFGTGKKVKAVIKKSHQDMLKEGFKSPDNSHCVVSMTPLSTFPRNKESSLKVKAKKLNFGKKAEHRLEAQTFAHKAKKTEMDMAKFLLEKAKQANLLQQQAKAKRLASMASKKVIHRREFVLPSQSSRSSRVIIPNKRFLEDDSMTSPTLKKKKSLQNNSATNLQDADLESPTKMDGTMVSPLKRDSLGKPVGSLEKPLIVDGKRDRKPSVKVLEKIVDNSDKSSMGMGYITSPIAAPKLGKNLFPSLSGPPTTFKKASESQKFVMFGSTRKQGASIVQKAKLHLNRAALNKSKAALARSLKAEMKREAKLAEIEKQSHDTAVTEAEQAVAQRPTPSRKRPTCIVCGAKGKTKTVGSRTDIVWCYKKFYACQACLSFIAKSRYRAKMKVLYKCDRDDPGNCKFSNKYRPCQLCRIMRIIQLGFPYAEILQSLTQEKPEKPKPKQKVTPVKSLRKSLEATGGEQQEPVIRLFNVEGQMSGRKSSVKMEMHTPVKDQNVVGDLTPSKDGLEQKRRRRSSKEPLKSPLDKGKLLDQDCDPERSTSLIVPMEGSVEELSPQSISHGPRIKHVCRNAAVVLGKTPATFPEKSEFRLSALPNKDKVEIWKQEEEVKAATSADSDDDRPLDEIIEKSADGNTIIVKKAVHVEPKEKRLKKLVGPGGVKVYKKKRRCKQCPGCLRTDCGKCKFCLDMPKFGGRGTIRQACDDMPKFGGRRCIKKACIQRKCENPLIQRSATAAFIKPKLPQTLQVDTDTESNTDSVHSSPTKLSNVPRQIDRPMELIHESEFEMSKKVSTSVPISFNESECQTLDENVEQNLHENVAARNLPSKQDTNLSNNKKDENPRQINVSLPVQYSRVSEQVSRNETRTEVRRLEFDSGSEHRLENLGARRVGKIRSKVKEKVEIQQKYAKNPGNNNNNNQCFPVTLVDPASRQWGHAMSQPRYHPIRLDYKGKCDVNNAWIYGIAVTMSSAMSVRTLCFLCASSGKHELVFCNVCCEPFHKFCLEEFEQPVKGHDADWCCARCQFCSVCGRQNNLLQCDKCQNMYHPECLGPNYPTKPTKEKKIWICTKCVKCKSCGATTPGVTSDATWTYDFSLCYECGKLMDKGNFCPICRKCYSDDDWESKMIQCNMCESWVHSNCEGLTDEMYEILSCLPEDLSFYCQRCSPQGCPEWLRVLREELRLGLENIMQTLILSKCAQYIIKREITAQPPSQICDNAKSEIQQPITEKDNKLLEDETLQSASPIFANESKPCLEETIQQDSNTSVVTDNKQDEKSGKNVIEKSENQSTLDNGICTSSQNDSAQINNDQNTLETEKNERTRVDFDNSINTENGSLQIVPIKAKVGDSGSGGAKLSGLKICDTIKNFVEGDSCVEEANRMLESCGVVKPSSVSDSNVLTQSCEVSVEKVNSSEKIEDTKNQADQSRSDVDNHSKNETAMNRMPAVDNKAVEMGEIKQSECVSNEMKNCKVVLIKTPTKTVPTKHHVQFNIAGNKIVEPADIIDKVEEPDYPRDLMEIAERMKIGFYKSVALFCEDILRIIQQYLDNDEEIRVSRKKSIQSAKAVFVKQMEKRFPWFQIKQCRYWYSSKNIPDGMLPDATLPPTIDHTYAQWLQRTELPKSPQPSPFKRTQTPVKKYVPYDEEEGEIRTFLEGEDTRRCMFCLQFGDQDPYDAGRLLFCGQDDWAHINCALWSAEVYEDVNGALRNLVEAYSRGKMLKCDLCGLSGATVGCNTKGCKSNYHFMCAREDFCRFQEDKKVFCKYHKYHVDGELLTRDRFGVYRRVYVDCLNVRSAKKQWAKGLNSIDINVLIGSCCVEALGRLTDLSDKPRFLQPVDFVSTRIYWSTKDARRRCVYTCRIIEVRPQMTNSPIAELKDTRIVHDESHPEFIPFSQLDLGSLNLSHLKSNPSTSESFVVDLTYDESTLSAVEGNSCSVGDLTQYKSLADTKDEVSVGRSMSFSGVSNVKESYKKDTLSKSWSGLELKKIQKPVKLKGLSPQTLRLLNIKDPLKEVCKASENESNKDNDLSLLKIADRLNSAAAKSSHHSREGSQSPLTVPLMRNVHRNRSRSLDSAPSISYMPTLPTVKETGPAYAWTPPTRLSSRANSWPTERQTYVSLLDKSIHKSNYNNSCELMDIDPISEPIDASSPKFSNRNLVNVNPETSQEKMEFSLESSHITEDDTAQMEIGSDQKVIELQVEGSKEEIPEATFVVMTDTSEEISEEEAIKIVQEALSGNSDILDTDANNTQGEDSKDCEVLCTDDGVVNTDKNETSQTQSEVNEKKSAELKNDTESNELQELNENERSDSPFIPQFVPPSSFSKKPINRKEVIDEERASNTYVNTTQKDAVTISDGSDCDSDVLDITDSVYSITNNEGQQRDKIPEIPVSCSADVSSGKKDCIEPLDTGQIEEGSNESNSEIPTLDKELPEESKPEDIVDEDEVDGDRSVEHLTQISAIIDCIDDHSSIQKDGDQSLGSPTQTFELLDTVDNQPSLQNDADSDGGVTCSNHTEEDNQSDNVKEVSNDKSDMNETEEIEKNVEEIDPQKKQVLRGLGLGTSDEVEQIKKNSPTKPSTCFNTLTTVDCKRQRKPKYSPIKVKKYPLRRKTFSPSKYLGNNMKPLSKEKNETDKAIKTSVNEIRDKDEFHECEKKSELPVLDPIAKKIKEESLAKSCPEEKGPFKCQTCRRLYRTETSYEIHVKNCTFYVSSSDEDSESSKGLTEDSGSEKPQKKKLRSTKGDKNSGSDSKGDDSEKAETFTRSSLRKSTMYQRVAIEVEERRLKEEALNTKSHKKESKKSSKPKSDEKEEKDTTVDIDTDVTRRVTRRSGGDHTQMLDLEIIRKRIISQTRKSKEKESKADGKNSSCNEEDLQISSSSGRRSLRRQRQYSSNSDSEPVAKKVMKFSEDSDRKVRTRSTSNSKEIQEKSIIKDQKGSGSNKKTEEPAEVLIISDDEKDIVVNTKQGDKERTPNDESETILDKSTVTVDTKEGGDDPILDYVSGLIVDSKTGIIYSPTKKASSRDSDVDKKKIENEGENSDNTVNEEGIKNKCCEENVDENSKFVNKTKQDEYGMDCDHNEVEEKNTMSPKSVENVDQTGEKSVTNTSDSEQKSVPSINKTNEKIVDVTITNQTDDKTFKEQEDKNYCENIKQGPGRMVSLENSQDMPKAELSKAVLQLLKKGHKVLIKNPTSDKSYVWEKTESGYVGKPLDKNIHSPVGKPLNKNVQSPESNVVMSNVKDKSAEKPLMSPECEQNIQKALSIPDSVREVSKTLVSPTDVVKETKKPLTASEILANKRKARDKQKTTIAQVLAKETQEKLRDILKEKTVHDQETSIVKNLRPIAPAGPLAPAGAEYLGGILFSKKPDQTSTDLKLRSTAQVASAALQNSLQIKNDIGAGVKAVYGVTGNNQSLVQFLSPNSLRQPTLRHPIMYQNLLSTVTCQPSTMIQPTPVISQPCGVNPTMNRNILSTVTGQPSNMIQPTPVISQPCGVNPTMNRNILSTVTCQPSTMIQPTPVISQPCGVNPTMNRNVLSSVTGQLSNMIQPTPVISQSCGVNPTMNRNVLSSVTGQLSNMIQPTPVISQSCGVNQPMNQMPMLTSQLLQQTTVSQENPVNLNKTIKVGASMTQNLPNILKKFNEPFVKPTKEIRPKFPVSTDMSQNQLSSSKELKSVKITEPTAEASIQSLEKMKLIRYENFKKKMESLIKQPPSKPIVKPSPKSPLKDHASYFKKQTFKKYKRKQVLKIRSPLKARKPSIAVPRTSVKASHPIIHPQKENLQLPIAAVEEEIQDIPLSTMMELDNFQGGHTKTGQSLGHLEFEITSDDGFSCKADTLDGAWKQVIEKVQDAREANRFKQLSYTGLSGIEMFGLSHPNVVYLLEQLSGAGYCRKYQFKYHKHEQTEQEVELLNPSGCIRSEAFSGRNPWDMFSFLMSRYRQLPERTHQGGDEEMVQKSSRRATSMDLPMAMRFRKLKAFSRECVGVYRSHIHGRGLFCKRNIDAGEMIIEYAGEVIRNSMTDSREMYYESKGIGCYMFRIDDEFVVDATMKGSAARFINHSCEPNCYSKVITVDNRKHIVIFALRQIYRGEELTYDYKFPIEEVKIPCTCGAQKCRKYLN